MSRTLRWAGLYEAFSEIRDDAGNRQIVSREDAPVAIKVGTQSLVEKYVRFQESRYQEETRPLLVLCPVAQPVPDAAESVT